MKVRRASALREDRRKGVERKTAGVNPAVVQSYDPLRGKMALFRAARMRSSRLTLAAEAASVATGRPGSGVTDDGTAARAGSIVAAASAVATGFTSACGDSP